MSPTMSIEVKTRPETARVMRDGILHLLAENRPFHSEFQLEHFVVIGSGRTRWGMYCQSLRELRTRFEALKLDYVRMRRIENALAARTWTGRRRLRGIDRTERLFELESLASIARDREREFFWFWDVTRTLRDKLGNLTAQEKAKLERETWVARIRELVACELKASAPVCTVSPPTWHAVSCLPIEERDRLVNDIETNAGKLVDEWLQHQPQLPPIGPAPSNARAIVEAIPCL